MFGKQDAVESINVDLDTKVISIHFRDGMQLADDTVIGVINDAGYDVRELRYGQ